MTKIEWTEKTLNVITGCTPISDGCQNCYARKMHKRLTAMGQEKYKEPFEKIVFHNDLVAHNFDILGRNPKMVFINSMSDTFHEDISDDDVKIILWRCKWNSCLKPVPHTFQLLTKRAHRLPDFEYPENVWLGVTVELAKYKDRIEYLKQTDAKVKFLSCEPLPGDLGELDLTGIDWVIVGGESGHNARPMHPDWVRNIQRQCAEQGIPFFFKQWGEFGAAHQYLDGTSTFKMFHDKNHWINKARKGDTPQIGFNGKIMKRGLDFNDQAVYPVAVVHKWGKKKAGCLLDGKEYKEYPKDGELRPYVIAREALRRA